MKKIIAVICTLILCIPICVSAEDTAFEGRNALQFAASYPGRYNDILTAKGADESLTDMGETFQQYNAGSWPDDGCYGCHIPNGYVRISKETGNIMYAYSALNRFKNGESQLTENDFYKTVAIVESLEFEYRYEEHHALDAILGEGEMENVFSASLALINQILTEDNLYKLDKNKDADEVYCFSREYDYYLVYQSSSYEDDVYQVIQLEIKAPGYDFSPLTDK